jgi:lysophospholipase L1-like esterase
MTQGWTRRTVLAAACAAPLIGCTARALPAPTRLMPVGNRNNMFWTPFSGPNYEECQSRVHHVNGAVGVSEIRLRFVGWALDALQQTSAEIDAPNDLEVLAAIEYPVGVFTRATFSGSERGRVPRGQTIDTDVMALTLPPGAAFHLRCLVRAGPGGRYPFGTVCKQGLDGYESGPTGALMTKVTEGSIGSTGHHSVYTASAILGVPDRPAHGVVVFGDSITYGFDNGLSEDTPGGGDAMGRHGYLDRALGALGVNSVNLSAPGMAAFKLAADEAVTARRMAFVADIGDVAINGLGRNDWGAFWKSDGELMEAQTILTTRLATAGLASILVTNSPWTDPANPKFAGDPATQAVWRQQYNAALRAAAGVQPVLDVAAVTERNGLWVDKAWESDGTHLRVEGNAGLARAITPALQALLQRLPLPAGA